VPRRKRSEGKATWPGPKQVFRRLAADGTLAGDTVGRADEALPGTPLLQPAMRAGRHVGPPATLAASRARCVDALTTLPPALRQLEPAAAPSHAVTISDALQALAREVDAATR
jgi:nicotinate phosphoribosyltransferase